MPAFEYLRSIGIGYYYPGESFLHRRDARIKILFFGIFILSVTLTNSLYRLLFGLLVACLGFWMAKIPILPCLRTMRTALPFILILLILQLILHNFNAGSDPLWKWGIFTVYESALFSALRIVVRFFTLILVLGLMTAVLSTLEMNHGLEMLFRPLERLGVRTDMLVMVVQIMLRFLPLLALRMEEIAKSQAARGAEWDSGKGGIRKRVKLALPLIIPLFLHTLQQAERIADAMLCRGYGLHPVRSHYYEYKIGFADLLFLLIGLGISGIILYSPAIS